jgi:hypothetical protein
MPHAYGLIGVISDRPTEMTVQEKQKSLKSPRAIVANVVALLLLIALLAGAAVFLLS